MCDGVYRGCSAGWPLLVHVSCTEYTSTREDHNLLVPQILGDFLALTSRHPCSSNRSKVIRLSYRRVASVRCISLVRFRREVVRTRLWSICIVLFWLGLCSVVSVCRLRRVRLMLLVSLLFLWWIVTDPARGRCRVLSVRIVRVCHDDE